MIFNIFGSKSKIGIDIGTSSIKLVELEKKSGRHELINYGIFELKGLTSGTGQSILRLPDDEIVWGIKEVMAKAGIKGKDVIASIPSFSTFSTVIEIPYLSEEDLAKAIPLEAKKYVPIPLDEVVVDWSIISTKDEKGNVTQQSGPQGTASKSVAHPFVHALVEVFFAAVPKTETVRYQNVMRSAGLNLKALELENSSIIRALLGNDLAPAAIINIGGRSTSIIIVDRGYERVGHSYEVGGFEITKSIARSLSISFEKAEELKKQYGLREVNENVVNEAMASLVDRMAFEAKKTISNYQEVNQKKIERVILIGGLTNMPNFAEYFSNKLGLTVISGNPFARVSYNQVLASMVGELGNVLVVATGLAMRDI